MTTALDAGYPVCRNRKEFRGGPGSVLVSLRKGWDSEVAGSEEVSLLEKDDGRVEGQKGGRTNARHNIEGREGIRIVAASATNAFGQHPGPGQVGIRKQSGIWERRGGEERRGEERRRDGILCLFVEWTILKGVGGSPFRRLG
jgi:hypothetical protein